MRLLSIPLRRRYARRSPAPRAKCHRCGAALLPSAGDLLPDHAKPSALGMKRESAGQKVVTSMTGSATKKSSPSTGEIASEIGAREIRQARNSIGATGGLLAPMTTEQATIDPKWMGSTPFATITG